MSEVPPAGNAAGQPQPRVIGVDSTGQSSAAVPSTPAAPANENALMPYEGAPSGPSGNEVLPPSIDENAVPAPAAPAAPAQ